MKNCLFLFAFLLFTAPLIGQLKFGFRVGTSTQDVKPEELFVRDQDDNQTLGIKLNNANYGVHLGFFAQIRGRSFFIQPEVLYNASKVDFQLNELGDIGIVGDLVSETYRSLDIPINFGLRLGPLRFQGGPVGHVFLGAESELTDIPGYEPQYNGFSLGYQAGLGLDIWKFIIDLKYEGNFSKWGDHFNFFGRQYSFDQSPGRLVASLGIAF